MKASRPVARNLQKPEPPDMAAGRKGLPAAQRKSVMLRVLVTKENRKTLEKAARSAGMELSTWIRSVALQAAEKPKD